MSDGFNNIFDPYRGSLCGRFPAGPVFVSVFLALKDQRGEVDYSIPWLHRTTGWPMELLEEAIHDLMQPDPDSRSRDMDGRRIVLIDPTRPWGWRVVNHHQYKEKARLMVKAAIERDSGTNRERMRDRRRPPETAGDRLSYSNTQTTDSKTVVPVNQDQTLETAAARGREDDLFRSESEPETEGSKTAETTKTVGKRGDRFDRDRYQLTPAWEKIAVQQGVSAEETYRVFANYWTAKTGRDSTKLDWTGTWENWCIKEGKELRRRQSFSKQPERPRAKDFPS